MSAWPYFLASLLDDYWELMPKYQKMGSIDDVELLRVLFGYFPTYRDSPFAAHWDRITQIGDAAGMQSPLSFGRDDELNLATWSIAFKPPLRPPDGIFFQSSMLGRKTVVTLVGP
jgi:hypothetical protein